MMKESSRLSDFIHFFFIWDNSQFFHQLSEFSPCNKNLLLKNQGSNSSTCPTTITTFTLSKTKQRKFFSPTLYIRCLQSAQVHRVGWYIYTLYVVVCVLEQLGIKDCIITMYYVHIRERTRKIQEEIACPTL